MNTPEMKPAKEDITFCAEEQLVKVIKERDSALADLMALQHRVLQMCEVWNRQCGRVFESMGEDNPRAQAIDESIKALAAECESQRT